MRDIVVGNKGQRCLTMPVCRRWRVFARIKSDRYVLFQVFRWIENQFSMAFTDSCRPHRLWRSKTFYRGPEFNLQLPSHASKNQLADPCGCLQPNWLLFGGFSCRQHLQHHSHSDRLLPSQWVQLIPDQRTGSAVNLLKISRAYGCRACNSEPNWREHGERRE